MHLHPEMVPREARCLRNQVICMIAEYHLTNSARCLSSLSPVLPEVAKPLLPPIKSYVSSVAFEGTWDVRVLNRAKTLRVAAWLHQLDMSAGGDGMASKTLEASRHSLGPLLESFLAPTMSNLSFQEVVDCILHENRHDAQHSLDDLRAHRAHIHQELDDLIQAHRESEKSSRKRIKKEIDMILKDLKSLKEHISQYESHLEQDTLGDNTPDSDNLLDHGVEAEMATTPGADDAPSESTPTQASNPPPAEGHAMEVAEEGVVSPQASPVSCENDDLLTGSDAIGVEAGLVYLSHLLGDRMVRVRKPPFLRPFPHWSNSDCKAVPETASMMPLKKRRN